MTLERMSECDHVRHHHPLLRDRLVEPAVSRIRVVEPEQISVEHRKITIMIQA
jgi:hypothetical protein